MKAEILVVEDDLATAEVLRESLESFGYQVRHADSGGSARAELERRLPDLVLLDLMLPDVDGLVLCSNLRVFAPDVPIVICSAASQRRERIVALKLGADDFVTKPFDIEELEARIEAVLRRGLRASAQQAVTAGPSIVPPVVRVGPLEVDRERQRVSVGGRRLHLTPTEFRLLAAFATHPDHTQTYEDLTELAWDGMDLGGSRTISVHVHRLREKLRTAAQQAGVNAPAIAVIRGLGYQMVSDPGPEAKGSAA